MEAQLLECLEALSSAGDDERARLRKVSRTVGYEELPKSWKALVKVAAAKIGLKEFEENPLGPRKGTRRGGRRKRRQEADPSDLIVADSDEGNPAFKLCRAILVQRKSDIEEEGLDQIRNMCEKGIHPAWERLAREAPVFAELSRFPVKEQTGNELGGGGLGGTRQFRSTRPCIPCPLVEVRSTICNVLKTEERLTDA